MSGTLRTTHGHGEAGASTCGTSPFGRRRTADHDPAGALRVAVWRCASLGVALDCQRLNVQIAEPIPAQAGLLGPLRLGGIPVAILDVREQLQTTLGTQYSLDREIGRGGMATVYLAQDRKHHRPVALKVLHPELAATLGSERFLREIEIAARLQHPHILPLYDSGQAGSLLYYVMPFVEGESLRTGSIVNGRSQWMTRCGSAGMLPRARLRAPSRRGAPRHQA